MKKFLMAAVAGLCITLSICSVVITVSYYNSVHRPRAKANCEGLVEYEQMVDSASEATELFWKVREGFYNR